MKKNTTGIIVAIGGGEMGRTKIFPDGRIKKYPIETAEIDQAIVQLSHKKHPKLLFLGTATKDKQSYIDTVKDYFEKKYNCRVSALKLTENNLTYDEIQNAVQCADIIYVGGGDTRYMINLWRRKRLIPLLKKAYKRGCVLSGNSAGAVCWFEYYDNMDYINGDLNKLSLLKGLGIAKGFSVPHYDLLNEQEKTAVNNLAVTQPGMAYAIDEGTACIIEQNKVYAIISKKGKEVIDIRTKTPLITNE